MARWWLALTLAMVLIAGCIQTSEDSAFETDADPTPDAEATGNETQEAADPGPDPLDGRFLPLLDNASVNAAESFNVTLDYAGDSDADFASLAWDVQVTPEDPDAESLAFDGVGLPATITLNLTAAGNATMTGNLTDGNSTVPMEPFVITVLIGDPCVGAPAPEPFAFSGLWVAVAVDGVGFYQPEPFPMPECVTKVFVEVSSSEGYLDPMLRLKDDTGTEVDNEDNEFLYHETLTYEAADGYLTPGDWQLDLRGYAGGPGNYEGTITFNPVE